MINALLILVAIVLAAVLVLMFVQLVRGDFCATVWWCFGGAGQVMEVLAEVVAAIFSAIADVSR